MAKREHESASCEMKIVITEDGPYLVQGNVPLVRKIQVVSEYGEPLTWRVGEVFETPEGYELCRCGQSHFRPFCDVTHCMIEYDGTETADPGPTAGRQETLAGGRGIVVRRDYSLCSESGFCATRFTRIEEMVTQSAEPEVRARIMAMIDHCPSGSFVYAIQEGEPDIEPDLPRQIAVITEITSDGPIAGPLWVTGKIPIERADGQPLETRNRVTLCCCGESGNKPLCDGSHRELAARDGHVSEP